MNHKFHTLYFESTRNCNFNCKYCSTGSGDNKQFKDLATDKIIERIFKPAKKIGTKFIDFSGGEFLLRKDYKELLTEANKMGFGIGIVTNGSLLNDKNLSEIRNILDDNIVFSLGINSFDNENKKTRNKDADFTIKLIEKLQSKAFRINISVTIGSFNKHNIKETLHKIKEMHLPFNRIPFVPRNCSSEELMLDKESLKDFFHPELIKYFNGQISYTPYCLPTEVYEEISTQNLKEFALPLNPSVGCWIGSYYSINPEGDVSPCPLFGDSVIGGNILQEKLEDILFKSELFTKITDRKNLEGKCGNCKYTYTCGGCRVMAYYKTGSPYAEDPTCFINDISKDELEKIEEQTIKSFKNYNRMSIIGKSYKKK